MFSFRLLISLSVSCACTCLKADSPRADELTDPMLVAKSFFDSLLKKDFKAAVKDFDVNMAKALPADKLEATWKGVLQKFGACQKMVSIRGESQGQSDTVYVGIQFEKSRMDLKVAIDGARRIAGFSLVPSFKPPVYADLSSFSETEVKVGDGEWQLPATLSLPKRSDLHPCPAIVLVHGSGPQDRDESTGPNKPFCDLAWGLATRGIAVLRYEKRTKAHSEKMMGKSSTLTLQEETIDDARAAVALLRQHKFIDSKRIFVLGHSFGAFACPRIVEQDKAIAGAILLAGNTRPLEELMLEQVTYLNGLNESSPRSHNEDLDRLKKEVERIKKLREAPASRNSDSYFGLPAAYWLELSGYDPAATAARLGQPLLILQGARDYQVTMDDFQGWKKALATRTNVELKLYPTLNHLFMPAAGKATPAEYEKPGHVSSDVVNDIVNWIQHLN